MASRQKKNGTNPSPDQINRLANGTMIDGDITVNSCIRIDGTINGNIICKEKLILGTEGIIKGNIEIQEGEVDGSVEGNILSKELLSLHHTAKIKGDIATQRLIIEDGAQIDGNISTGSTPSSKQHSSKKKEVKDEEEPIIKEHSDSPSDIVY